VKVVQRIPVKIVLDPGENKDHLLRPGMSVDSQGVDSAMSAAAPPLDQECRRGVRR
jgi:multidrug resistance efflux pump